MTANRTLSFILLCALLLIPISTSAKTPEEMAFFRAEEDYKNGNFLIAEKRFRQFTEEYPASENVPKARMYVAACQLKSGNVEDAVITYMSIIEGGFEREYIVEAILGMGKTGNRQAKAYLEGKLYSPDIRVREAVAQALGTIGNNVTVKKMMKALEGENEIPIQERLLASIATIGGNAVKFKSFAKLFEKGSEELRINIVNFLSAVRNNHIVGFLRNQMEESSSRLRPYIIRSLARVDPYTYGVRLEGKLVHRKEAWILRPFIHTSMAGSSTPSQ